MADRPQLIPSAGIPAGDNQNSRAASPRGPLLVPDPLFVQDRRLFEKPAHFYRERIAERGIDAMGSAAFAMSMAPRAS